MLPLKLPAMYTRSPALKRVSALVRPTHSIVPAPSVPGVYGSEGFRGYVPARMYVSTGFTPMAWMRTTTWPAAGLQIGHFFELQYFGPAEFLTRIAFMAAPLPARESNCVRWIAVLDSAIPTRATTLRARSLSRRVRAGMHALLSTW